MRQDPVVVWVIVIHSNFFQITKKKKKQQQQQRLLGEGLVGRRVLNRGKTVFI